MDISKCYKSEPFFKEPAYSTSLHLTLVMRTSNTNNWNYHEIGRHWATVCDGASRSVPQGTYLGKDWNSAHILVPELCALAWCSDLPEEDVCFHFAKSSFMSVSVYIRLHTFLRWCSASHLQCHNCKLRQSCHSFCALYFKLQGLKLLIG